MRGRPRGLEVVAAARDQLPCRITRGARRDAQRVGALQSRAARARAPRGFQFPQFNELGFRGHGRVARGLAPAVGASERGAGGAAGRTPMQRRPRDPSKAAGENPAERRNRNSARGGVERRGCGVGRDLAESPPAFSFSPRILEATPILLTTTTTPKGHSETDCF